MEDLFDSVESVNKGFIDNSYKAIELPLFDMSFIGILSITGQLYESDKGIDYGLSNSV